MAKKQKYYVVWAGVTPGIYSSWSDCQLQTKGFTGAIFKSFETEEEAKEAYHSLPQDYVTRHKTNNTIQKTVKSVCPSQTYIENALAVDAGCSGNPGKMEYRGVYVANRQQLFHFGPIYGTNNIGEFLAIVHGLAMLQKQGLGDLPVYSDSRNAINWVKQKKCKTKLPQGPKTEAVYEMIRRAESWLQSNTYKNPILKWETELWGEIPADFGRK